MKLVKLLVSLACCLLFSTPLWAANIPPIEKATPNPSGLYALSHLAASGAVTELTDQELARIEGGTICTTSCILTMYDFILSTASPTAVIATEAFKDVTDILTVKPAPPIRVP